MTSDPFSLGLSPEEIEAKKAAVLAGEPAELKNFLKLHAEDLSTFQYAFRRYGDFLTIEAGRRLARYDWRASTYCYKFERQAITIGLPRIDVIKVLDGERPTLSGKAYFLKQTGVMNAREKFIVIFDRGEKDGYKEKIFWTAPVHAKADKQDFFRLGNTEIHLCDGCAAASVDDVLDFSPIAKLYIPFGRGREVFEALMVALGSYWEQQFAKNEKRA